MVSFWLAFPTGILIAAVVSAVGIGGGILWMPFLMLILKLEPEASVMTSLMIQSAGMGSGSLAYARQARIDYKLAAVLLAARARLERGGAVPRLHDTFDVAGTCGR